MHRYWLIFSQAVTLCLAFLFTFITLRPDWISAPSNLGNTFIAKNASLPGISYAAAVSSAAQSVVNIYTEKAMATSTLPDVPSLRPFIQARNEEIKKDSTSLGSGIIVRSDGYILTNYHVVKAANVISVALQDGRTTSAKLIGSDPDTDLAVLKIDLPNLPVIHYNEQDPLKVGDVVLAIGNPFGVGQTTTMGIISALGREGLGISTYENFIQTDAAINPGNSGGALINTQGDLIGINSAIFSESNTGGSLGIGFATPATSALKIMQDIITNGFVPRGWLGIEPQDVSDDLAKAFNLPSTQGVIIATLRPNGPASQAGLVVGDIIIQCNGVMVKNTDWLLSKVGEIAPKTKISLQILRNGKPMSKEITLGQRPSQATS